MSEENPFVSRRAPNNAVSELLTKRRKQLGISRKIMSEKVGLDRSTIFKFENGTRSIVLWWYEIAKAYQIPPMTLAALLWDDPELDMSNVNLVSEIARLSEAGVESFTLAQLYQLAQAERDLGFKLQPDQLRVWLSKNTPTSKPPL